MLVETATSICQEKVLVKRDRYLWKAGTDPGILNTVFNRRRAYRLVGLAVIGCDILVRKRSARTGI